MQDKKILFFLLSLLQFVLYIVVDMYHSFPPFYPLSAPKSYLQFVGGKACKSVSGCSVALQSPGGSTVLAYCPDGGRKDVRNAVEAAVKVQSR